MARVPLRLAWLLLLALPAPRALAQVPAAAPARSPVCQGAYADDLSLLSDEARARSQEEDGGFSFCVRSKATYECLSYGPDGGIQRTEKAADAHGTAFAYRRDGAATLLATNEHVVSWPLVTSAEHAVEDVPEGCKRVASALTIVDDEVDAFQEDDVPLSLVVADARLDVAVVRAEAELAVMPWAIGRSSALRVRNVVEVRGFPLGAFRATSMGKVISVYDRDTFKDWDHDDFVIDALLSSGNSGSPVLGVSCETGAYELVGIYHARYARGAALNVVIGIDQVRQMLDTLNPPAPKPQAEAFTLDPAGRAQLAELARARTRVFFPFGKLTAAVRGGACGALVFELYSPDFPLEAYPIALLEDLPPASADRFGEIGRAFFGRREGLRERERATLGDEDAQAVERLLDGLRKAALATCSYRDAALDAHASRERTEAAERLASQVRRLGSANKSAGGAAVALAARLAPAWSAAEPLAQVIDRLSSRPECGRAEEAPLAPEGPPAPPTPQPAPPATPSIR